jgi:hypothetical protein
MKSIDNMNEYMNITNLINEYIREWRVERNEESYNDELIKRCKEAADFRACIEIATRSKSPNNKIHPHQWRIGGKKLEEFLGALLQLEAELLAAKSFDEIHTIAVTARTPGVGQLTTYDIALRIGANRNLLPDKIYLHAGTKEGLRILLGKQIRGKRFITLQDLPYESFLSSMGKFPLCEKE